MAEFAEIAPVTIPGFPEVQQALNFLVAEVNQRLGQMYVEKATKLKEDWGTRKETIEAAGTTTVLFNKDLPTAVGAGGETKLGEWLISTENPLLLLARGVFVDATDGATLHVRVRARDLKGKILDELLVTLDTDGANARKASWNIMAVRESPTVSEKDTSLFGGVPIVTAVRIERISRYVLTGQVSGASANATVEHLKLINLGLS